MPDVEHEWNPRPRTYASEVVLAAASPVTEHPLQPKEKAEPKPTGTAPLPEAPMDPLSLMMAAAKLDPLGANDPLGASGSAPGAAFSSVGSVLLGAATHDEEAPASRFLTWKHRRADILKQYAVAGQIKINSDLLNVDGIAAASLGSNLDDGAAAADKKVNMLDAKTRGRLEQLEQAEGTADESRIIRLTQQELVSRVDKLNVELGKAWEAEERVRALKIAIQVSKMLGDTAFPQFYPTVFVLVTEMLDHFGELVYARVHAKGQAPSKTLREGFAPSEVLEEGVETTKNWFYKVASIRELVPRFYVELAILKCYRLLLPPAQIVANVRRLILTVRGMGEPLCATYARSYLVHKILQVMPCGAWGSPELIKDVHEPLWDTFTVLKQQLASEAFLKGIASRNNLSPPSTLPRSCPRWSGSCSAPLSRMDARRASGRWCAPTAPTASRPSSSTRCSGPSTQHSFPRTPSPCATSCARRTTPPSPATRCTLRWGAPCARTLRPRPSSYRCLTMCGRRSPSLPRPRTTYSWRCSTFASCCSSSATSRCPRCCATSCAV